jgi:hypothetical protein
MAKSMKAGPKETRGLKFVDTSAFVGRVKSAHEST